MITAGLVVADGKKAALEAEICPARAADTPLRALRSDPTTGEVKMWQKDTSTGALQEMDEKWVTTQWSVER